jgi:hypothetical protein
MMTMLVPQTDAITKLDAGTRSSIAMTIILARSIVVIVKPDVPTAVTNVRFLMLATLYTANKWSVASQ